MHKSQIASELCIRQPLLFIHKGTTILYMIIFVIIVEALQPVLPTQFSARECEPAVIVFFLFLGWWWWFVCLCWFGCFVWLSVWMSVFCVGVCLGVCLVVCLDVCLFV